MQDPVFFIYILVWFNSSKTLATCWVVARVLVSQAKWKPIKKKKKKKKKKNKKKKIKKKKKNKKKKTVSIKNMQDTLTINRERSVRIDSLKLGFS
jgi:flagellar biosynthesis component FlhA